MSQVPAPRFVDPAGQLAFIEEVYLGRGGFVAGGGSKLKFVRGRIGSGKTRFLQELIAHARSLDYLTVTMDAAGKGIRRIDDLYRHILQEVDPWGVVRRFADQVVSHLGTDPARIPEGISYVEWAVQQARVLEIVRAEVTRELERRLFLNPNLRRSLAVALLEMTGDVLGVRSLSPDERLVLQNWVRGLPVPARERNRLNLREVIDRYTARLMLRSWLVFIRLSGYRGLVAVLDNLDVVLNTNPAVEPKYTKLRRDDLYETMRELIDEMDSLEGSLFVMAGREELFTDTKAGIHSYPALWMRIQNEVEPEAGSRQVNRFADIINLDRVWEAAEPEGFIELGMAVYGLGDGAAQPETVDSIRQAVERVLASRDLSISPVQRIVQSVDRLRRERQQ